MSKNLMNDKDFLNFLKKEYPNLISTFGMTFYDESWTDYQMRKGLESAFLAGKEAAIKEMNKKSKKDTSK